MPEKKTVLIGVTGGIAAYKIPDLVSRLMKIGYNVEVIMTEAAANLVAPLAFSTLTGNPVHMEMFHEQVGNRIEVEHIALADRADLIVVVPASANTLAKAANGIADNLLSSVLLAADSPVIYFPAMNTRMWEHPSTRRNIEILKNNGSEIIEPDDGFLACGTSGKGRLPSLELIESIITGHLEVSNLSNDLLGKRVLISAGPTEEPIDPVRCITNHSSGKMGYALAEAAVSRGADVILVSGPVAINPPSNVLLINVCTAKEMKECMERYYDSADITIMAAAVSDYKVKNAAPQKIKKSDEILTIELEKNPDILASLGENKHGFLVGFAAETQNLRENAVEKLNKKNLDLIIANNVTSEGAGFGSDTNIVTVFGKNGFIDIPKMSKRLLAHKILSYILNPEEIVQ